MRLFFPNLNPASGGSIRFDPFIDHRNNVVSTLFDTAFWSPSLLLHTEPMGYE